MFGFLKRLFGIGDDPEIVSLVLIEREPRILTLEGVGSVCQAIQPMAQIQEERPSYLRVKWDGWNFVVCSFAERYESLVKARLKDLRMAKAVDEHTGFVIVECFGAPEGHDRKEGREFLGRVVAAIADTTSLAFYDWTTQKYAVLDPEILDSLAEGQVTQAVEEYAGMVVWVDEAASEAASERARECWPEFMARFVALEDNRAAFVKARFEECDAIEHMWLTPTSVDAGGFTGVLLNTPMGDFGVREGDTVARDLGQVSDWVVTQNDQVFGGFSCEAVRDATR